VKRGADFSRQLSAAGPKYIRAARSCKARAKGRGALKVYPNPARNHFRIEVPEGAQHLESVQLWDVQGRAVRAWPAGQKQFDIEGLPAGMYVVRAMGKAGVFTQKLILEP